MAADLLSEGIENYEGIIVPTQLATQLGLSVGDQILMDIELGNFDDLLK